MLNFFFIFGLGNMQRDFKSIGCVLSKNKRYDKNKLKYVFVKIVVVLGCLDVWYCQYVGADC